MCFDVYLSFFFFKQKTAYEMRISDWSSDVCSSDLYMPSALPGLSAAKASELLQLTDRMIKSVPEVQSVFGKAGRAETATDTAPLEMFAPTHRTEERRCRKGCDSKGRSGVSESH